jgi:hypothetical protein
MKKATTSNTPHGIGTAGKNGKAHSTTGGPKKRTKRPDPFAGVESLDYPQSVGARMLKKFHDSLS